MDYYWLVARSITHAQRLEEAMKQEGIRVKSSKAPAGLTEKGCAYVLQLPAHRYRAAMQALRGADLKPYKVFYHTEDETREVPL